MFETARAHLGSLELPLLLPRSNLWRQGWKQPLCNKKPYVLGEGMDAVQSQQDHPCPEGQNGT